MYKFVLFMLAILLANARAEEEAKMTVTHIESSGPETSVGEPLDFVPSPIQMSQARDVVKRFKGRPNRPTNYDLATAIQLFSVAAPDGNPDGDRHFHSPFPECSFDDEPAIVYGDDIFEAGCYHDDVNNEDWEVRGFAEFLVVDYTESPMHQGGAYLTCSIAMDSGLFGQPLPADDSVMQIEVSTYFRKFWERQENPDGPDPIKRVYGSTFDETSVGLINTAGLSRNDLVSIDITDFYDPTQTDEHLLQGFKFRPVNENALSSCEAISVSNCRVTSLLMAGAGKDPHFVGFNGQRYEVQGTPGQVYQILSDNHIEMNALFDKSCDDTATTISAIGIKFNDFTISYNADGLAMIGSHRIDGRKVYELGSEEDYVVMLPEAKKNTMQVHAGGYIFTLETGKSKRSCENNKRVDFTVAMTDPRRRPSGILGMSAHQLRKTDHHWSEHNVNLMLKGTVEDFRVDRRNLFGMSERSIYDGSIRTRNADAVFTVRMAGNNDAKDLAALQFSHIAHPNKPWERDATRARRMYGLE